MIILVQATEHVEREVSAIVTTIGAWAFPTFPVIALKEFALMISLGWILLIKLDLITSMLNAQIEAFATATAASATAFLDMKAEDAKELLALMIALVMVAALLSRTCLMLLFLTIMLKVTSWSRSLKLSHTINGMDPKPEAVFVTLSMEMLIARRECASTALM